MSLQISKCPVPREQLPINEYQDLANSWFYRWATLGNREYMIPMVWIMGISWLLVAPVAAASFAPLKQPVQFFLGGLAGASFLLGLVLAWLYLGWTYVGDRLARATVPYEESGWYDGQTWEKPNDDLIRDRLVVTYEIQPFLRRLRHTFVILAVVFSVSVLTCVIL